MRLRINLVKNFTRKILSKISRANQYQTRNSKIFEGKKMKGKKKKKKRNTVQSRHVTAFRRKSITFTDSYRHEADEWRSLSPRETWRFLLWKRISWAESRVTQNGSIREDHDDWKTPLGKYAFSSNNIPFPSCYIHLKLGANRKRRLIRH